MNENEITIRGRVIAEPRTGVSGGGDPWASLRVASTTRRPAQGGGYEDGHTNYFTVKCWRALAANVGQSIRKGEPVVVTGVLKVSDWAKGDKQGTDIAIDARAVGHDLTFGRTGFTKVYGFGGGGAHVQTAARPAEVPSPEATDPGEVAERDGGFVAPFGSPAEDREQLAYPESAPVLEAPAGGLTAYGEIEVFDEGLEQGSAA